VPADQLRSLLGITDVTYVQGRQALAVVDSDLVTGGAAAPAVNS